MKLVFTKTLTIALIVNSFFACHYNANTRIQTVNESEDLIDYSVLRTIEEQVEKAGSNRQQTPVLSSECLDKIQENYVRLEVDSTYQDQNRTLNWYTELSTSINCLKIEIKNITKDEFDKTFKRECNLRYIEIGSKAIIFDTYNNVDDLNNNYLQTLKSDDSVVAIGDSIYHFELDKTLLDFIGYNDSTKMISVLIREHEWEFLQYYNSTNGKRLLSIDGVYAKVESPTGRLILNPMAAMKKVFYVDNGIIYPILQFDNVPIDQVCWNSENELYINARFKGYLSVKFINQ